MEILKTNPSAAVPLKTAEQSADTAISSDFETFLKMLTVQMQNQDPLNPVKSEDFAVQLATFAGVEQQVRTNDLLSGLQTQLGVSGVSEFASWIGKDARAPMPAMFDGAPITVAPTPENGAEEAFLVVRDAGGLEVQRMAIPVAAAPVDWDGATASGYPVADGIYSFTVESWKGGNLSSVSDAEVYAPVAEVRLRDGAAVLIMKGGMEVAASAVTGLRDP